MLSFLCGQLCLSQKINLLEDVVFIRFMVEEIEARRNIHWFITNEDVDALDQLAERKGDDIFDDILHDAMPNIDALTHVHIERSEAQKFEEYLIYQEKFIRASMEVYPPCTISPFAAQLSTAYIHTLNHCLTPNTLQALCSQEHIIHRGVKNHEDYDLFDVAACKVAGEGEIYKT